MEHINPVNYFGLAVLGAALLWAVRLVYAGRRPAGDDVLQRVLLLAGWLLLVGGFLVASVGVTGPLAVFPAIGLAILVEGYLRYAEGERRALLWALAVAAEKGLPLEESARALADERSVQIGRRAVQLAVLLERGAPLPQAFVLSRNALPVDALLAVRIGQATGLLGPALRMALDSTQAFEAIMRNIVAKCLYLAFVTGWAMMMWTFLMLKIIPVMAKMSSEFGLRLPGITQFLIAMSNFVVRWWPAVCLGMIPPLCLLAVVAAFYLSSTRYEAPGLWRLWRRRDNALILRALALAVRQQRPLGPTIYMLSREYPKAGIARRLERASRAINDGVPWYTALVSAGLLGNTEAAVLRAAERVNNLPWALEEMADSTLRRFAQFWQATLTLLFPMILLLLGALVATIVIGVFMPLINMISSLA